MNLLDQFAALSLLTGAGLLAAFASTQMQDLALFFLNAHKMGWSIGMVFLSGHVVLLGYLVYKSSYMPKVLGGLLVLVGVSYLILQDTHCVNYQDVVYSMPKGCGKRWIDEPVSQGGV